MAENIDRRVARTQAALRGALIRLLRRKEYAGITVQEILDEADIGRSTFYAHCSGKDQLVRLSFRLLRAELAAAAPTEQDPAPLLGFSLPIIQHLADHRDLYGAFAGGRVNELLFDELRRLVFDFAKRDLKHLPGSDGIPPEVMLQFVAGAFTALLAWWLNGRAKLAPDALDNMFQRLVGGGLTSQPSA
jgi:AcrR family transcriptional regulator